MHDFMHGRAMKTICKRVRLPIISGAPHHQNIMQVEVILITTPDDPDPEQLCS